MYVEFGYLRRTNILIVLWGQEINLLTEEQKGQKFFINVIIMSHAKAQICAEVMFVKIFRTVSA